MKRGRQSWLGLLIVVTSCQCVDLDRVRLYACADGLCAEGSLCCEGWCIEGSECPPPSPCEGGYLCDGQCVDLTLSDQNCGGCGLACTGTTTCAGGRCVSRNCADGQCAPNQVCIEDTCVPRRCVGHNCRDTEVCVEGECRSRLCVGVLCPAGELCASGVCSDVWCTGVVCPQGPCLRGRCDGEQGCANTVRDGPESDVDCGGTHCAACREGGRCSLAAECAGLSCADAGVELDGGVDAGTPPAPRVCEPAPIDALDLAHAAVLFHPAGLDARQRYAAQLNAGRAGMKVVIDGLLATPEFQSVRAEHPPRQQLRQYYAVMLGRELDPTGEAIYLPMIYAGRQADVLNALAASREFSTRYPSIP